MRADRKGDLRALIDAGVIRREVFDHEGLQKLLNAHRITMTPDAAMLAALAEDGIVSSALGHAIAPGKKVKIRGPFGHAFLRQGEGRIILVSTGTGLSLPRSSRT